MIRLFIPKEQFPLITGQDARYLKTVLRLLPGDQLELLDGSGNIHQAKIKSISNQKVICQILSSAKSEAELPIKITLAQAVPKGQKMDFVVEKATELGVYQILPLITARTIKQAGKSDRWQKLAKEAAEQCGRGIVPQVSPPLSFPELLKQSDQYALRLIADEAEKSVSLKDLIRVDQPENLLILVGPEGGWTPTETAAAKEHGFQPISLGKRILRSETAPLFILSALSYELG